MVFYYLRTISLLTLAYLALTSNLQLSNIVVGVLVAGLVIALLRPEPRKLDPRSLVGSVLALLRYTLILVYDVIVSGIQVARVVLSRDMPLRTGIIAIPSNCSSEMGRALSAHSITLTPGELVVEIDSEGVMYTHCLDATHAAEVVEEAQEMRRQTLDKIFA